MSFYPVTLRIMYSTIFLSSILSLVISIPYVFSYENTPVIAITQGIIETGNALPVSVFWYHPNFTAGNLQIVYFSDNGTKFTGYFTLDSYTGFHELPLIALVPNARTGNYCAAIQPTNGTSNIISSCNSKIQWMYDRRGALSAFSLRDLIIPGTHESAASISTDGNVIPCQSESIKTQLMDGIRFLDLRPSLTYRNKRIVYFAAYAGADLVPMNDIVDQIREFMNLSKDVVIVSFRGAFEGFRSDGDHLDFMAYLELSFQTWIHARRDWTYTLSQFWTADKRLILSYNHDLYRSSHYMWPPIPQYWGAVPTINQLHSHLDELHQNQASDVTPYAAMVAFTYPASDSPWNVFDSSEWLLHLAERLGRRIPRWYAEEWSSAANIITVDYYQTSGIVDIALQLNEKRAEEFQAPQSLPITNTNEN